MSNIAQQFAIALDADDFDTACSLLDENCIYKLSDKRFEGRIEIIDSYRESSDWAKQNLDGIEYASEIETLEHGEYIVRFLDRIRFRGQSHTYWCRQRLRLNAGGKICFIEHLEDVEQRRSIDDFFRENGLSRSS